ncbi:MAG: M10 family metallopeptidase, partial [Gammaproteobacteria bacterium SHHR-1]
IRETHAGTIAVCLNANVDTIQLSGAVASYDFLVQGNQVLIYSGTALIATLGVQTDSNGTSMGFSDGTASLLLTGLSAATLGGQAVGTTATRFDTSVFSQTTNPNTDASALLTQAQALSASNTSTTSLKTLADAEVTGVLIGSEAKWGQTSLTYSFPTSVPTDYTGDPDYTTNWTALNSTEQTAVRSVFALLDDFLPLTFTEVGGDAGDIRFSLVDMGAGTAGFAVTPGSNSPFGDGVLGDVFLSNAIRASGNYQPKGDNYHTIMHEIGHALGLKHTFESPLAPTGTDNFDYSLMSYTQARNMGISFSESGGNLSYTADRLAMPQGYALYDIAGLQTLYGANQSSTSGSNSYSLSSRDYDYLTIWDAAGTDTIDVSNAIGTSIVNLNPGSHSSIDLWTLEQQIAQTQAEYPGYSAAWIANAYTSYSSNLYTGENNLAIAYGVVIENLNTGAGDDQITDNPYDNQISTAAGNDQITLGQGGFDSIDGGSGTDSILLPNHSQAQIQYAQQSDGSYLLLGPDFAAQLIGIEQLSLQDASLSLVA